MSAALVGALAIGLVPAGAVTDGAPDGNAHPYVGLMVAYADEAATQPLWRCSGTLLSPTVFLTAGHCVEAPAASARVWFDADVQALTCGLSTAQPAPNCYPFGGGSSRTGDLEVYPGYNPAAFYLADVGVVVLDSGFNAGAFGALPSVNALDKLKNQRGQQDTTFTAVGYGLQESFPDAAAWKENNVRVRMVAHPKLNQINNGYVGDFAMILSNNAHTGGTCFGDSGGPNFLGTSNVVAGVTSFGKNGNCAGTGGVFRMDRSGPLNWVQSFLP
ncbi:MAG TPA: trypsin-like serine protease [Gaiellaceae bacterium]|nr:trypsin-like serine protease [Gaiellaceae bacterium]